LSYDHNYFPDSMHLNQQYSDLKILFFLLFDFPISNSLYLGQPIVIE